MTLNTAIEQGEINARKAVRTGTSGKYVAPSDAEYAKLDKVCQTFLTSVSTEKGGVVGKAYPGSRQAVADRVRRLRRELLRARRRLRPAAADQGDGLRQGLTWLLAAGQRCRPHGRL